MRKAFSYWVRRCAWFTPFRRWMFYRYGYAFTPEQLCYLVACLTATKEVPGDVIEVGCAQGHTTVFLKKHLRSSGISKRYLCIDTFCGFRDEDVAWEAYSRGKDSRLYAGLFANNSIRDFRYTLELNGFGDVICIEADVKEYTFEEPISFCLLDVDLYKPTLHALRHMWQHLCCGGMIVVDDCTDGNMWDGAYLAYREFTQEVNLRPMVVCQKLGVIQKS